MYIPPAMSGELARMRGEEMRRRASRPRMPKKPRRSPVYYLCWLHWRLTDQFDKIPGFSDASVEIYNARVARESA